jgi:hypothetical protein
LAGSRPGVDGHRTVLAIGDAVANKVCALFGNAEPRDHLDVDAIRQAGIFSDLELLTMAAEHDPGFDSNMFASQLDAIVRLTAEDVAEYGVSGDELNNLKRRLMAWQADLAEPSPGPGTPPKIYQRVGPVPRNLQHHQHESIYRRPTRGPGISP